MKQLRPRRLAAALLIAAALPLSALAAQEAQPATDPPAKEAPVTIREVPDPPEPAEPAEPAATTEAAPPRSTVRRTVPAPDPIPAPAPSERTVYVPVPVQTSPAPATGLPPADPYPLPPVGDPLSTAAPEVLPTTPGGGIDTVVEVEEEQGPNLTPLIWLAAGALLAGLIVYLLMRRRRRDTLVHHSERAHAHAAASAPAAEPLFRTPEPVVHEPPEVVPVAAAAPAAAAAVDAGRPWLDLRLHPVRAGIAGGEARVEFALDVANVGEAIARDVHISTWMSPAAGSEMEQALIERPAAVAAPETELPEVTIEPGAGKRIETEVTLPVAGLGRDSMLPVVVAEARYRLPDGSEARTSASFAVGVPVDEELASFALDDPSGLHEGVEARPLGEAERV